MVSSISESERARRHGFKRLDALIDFFPITPDDPLARLQAAYKVPPDEGAALIRALVDESFDLVEAELPAVDVDRLRSIFRYQRPVWRDPPPTPIVNE